MVTGEAQRQFIDDFQQRYRNGAAGPAWLDDLRRAAIEKFERLGFPTTHDEDWKYTSVEPIASRTFELPDASAPPLPLPELLTRSFADPECDRLVFINGRWVPDLSLRRGLPPGVRVCSLAEAVAGQDDLIAPYLAGTARFEKDSFAALNTAFMEDGAVIIVPENSRVEAPIHLIFAVTETGKRLAVYPRNLLVAGPGSELRIVESYVGLGGAEYLVASVTEIVGRDNSTIDYYRLQREGDASFHIGSVAARAERDCRLTAHAITLSGGLVRNDVRVRLDGEGSECVLNGIYLVDGREHVDTHTEIEHCRPRATSFELYKGILSGDGHAVFNGKIVVHKDAQKTDARQTNKNLLLSPGATVNTKPQLEINADDVKCSHGSTIGQLDRDALFYLRSRGLDPDEAQRLLSYAFASDVVGRMKIASLRARLDDYLLNKFASNGNQRSDESRQ